MTSLDTRFQVAELESLASYVLGANQSVVVRSALLFAYSVVCLVAVFAAAAGVASMEATRRFQELNVRRVLGQSHRSLVSSLVWPVLAPTLTGGLLGWAVARLSGVVSFSSELWGGMPALGIPLFVLSTGVVVATLRPALKILSVPPAEVLRHGA